MLTLLSSDASTRGGRLDIAAAHLQHAMAHLNAAAREQLPAVAHAATPELEELRLAIYALNDLLIDVTSLNRRLPERPSVVAHERPSAASVHASERSLASAPVAREA